ncbi:VPLPA-CTERM sorting domain-containing protein [Ruegeria atlantica]|nr:VPLPA-CTERM sorting domain-containing protein [Ruegeria atlantica]
MMIATGAHATTVNLMSGGDLHILGSKGTFNVDGVSGTVHAGSYAHNPRISQFHHGIGVRTSHDDTGNLDGLWDEWLTFTLHKTVRLISVTFAHVDTTDDWDVYVGHTRVANDSPSNPYDFGNVIASAFTILADGHKCKLYIFCKSDDNFVIKKFEFEHTPAPVPLPAPGLLLIGGLAGFGFMRRRKQQVG